jgi:hypothetical protein
MKAWLIPITLSLVAGTAHADQCAWIDAAVADKAQAILTAKQQFLELCEPCGDQAPGIPQRVQSVDIASPQADYREVSLNGKGIDLAYVFVKTDDTRYQNLAALAGCPATGVSPSLTIEAETTNGVLISADNKPTPPPQAATIVTEVPAYAPAPPPPPPPQVYVYSTTTHQVAWFAIALAAAGGLITGAAAMLALVMIRRRRAMRPRAMDITARVG